MKPIVLEEIGDQLDGLTVDEALTVIEGYFSHIIWSLEKEEWDRLSDAEKRSFVEYFIKARK